MPISNITKTETRASSFNWLPPAKPKKAVTQRFPLIISWCTVSNPLVANFWLELIAKKQGV
jgi:hypothetical protein